MNLVILQPMLFPWVGFFEQIRLADTYVHYDDVQFSKGSFVNRVQIKTAEGFRWMTVPLASNALGLKIDQLAANPAKNWQNQHREILKQSYQKAPYYDDMMAIVQAVYQAPDLPLADMLIRGIDQVCQYFDLAEGKTFLRASRLDTPGSASQRVFDITQSLNAKTYITGHGALRYLDHELFEQHGVSVAYMDYQKRPYPQLHGPFNPYVSILDLIANTGPEGKQYICSGTLDWKELQHDDPVASASST